MKALFCFTAFLVLTPIQGAELIIFDESMSMKGFAAGSGSRLPGVVQRLGTTLAAGGPVRYLAMRGNSSRAELQTLSLNEGALSFGNPTSFTGTTSPLVSALEGAVSDPSASMILLFTDGMESGGQVETIISALERFAGQGWAVGLAAVNLPFHGLYYTEQKIPSNEFLPQVRLEVKKRNPAWDVKPGTCEKKATSCYWFDGERPLLLVVLARKERDIETLIKAANQAFSQMQLAMSGTLRIAPAAALHLVPVLEATSQTQLTLRLPKSLQSASNQLTCLETSSQPRQISIVLRSQSEGSLPEPSELIPHSVTVVGARPSWVKSVTTGFHQVPATGAMAHDLELFCSRPGLIDRIVNSQAQLSGSLNLEYLLKRQSSSSGWWVDLDAQDTWRFPFKVYKLADVVRGVHEAALAQSPEIKRNLTLTLQVLN